MLTATTVLTLRESCRTLRNIGGGVDFGVPYIVYLPADDVFCLVHNGSPQAKHADANVLGHLLRNERVESGFIKRVLGGTDAPDDASLDPAAYAKRQALLAAQRRSLADADRSEAEAAARRLSHIHPAAISLEDLD